jgi:hypothetical protein
MTIRLLGALIALLFFAGVLLLGFVLGALHARREIAAVIRAGELSLQQRLEHVAEQVESGHYVSVEQASGGLKPWPK